jgi:hypothetical protein
MPQYRGRPIFVFGIPSLDYGYFAAQALEDPERWYELPEGAVVIIDEAQKVFPIRPTGSKVPKKSAEFETHRHRGHDVVLITQDGGTVDVHVRKLCGRHVHIHRLFGSQTSNIYDYAEYMSRPSAGATRKQSIAVSTFRFPVELFDRYKSADMHTVKRRLPKKVYVLPVMLLVLVGVCWFAWTRIVALGDSMDAVNGKDSFMSEAGSSEGEKVAVSGSSSSMWAKFKPEFPGMAWTAPAYAEVMQVRSAPRPQCMIMHLAIDECRCYTQQATPLLQVSESVCRDLAINGYFDFTQEDERRAERRDSDARRDPVAERLK